MTEQNTPGASPALFVAGIPFAHLPTIAVRLVMSQVEQPAAWEEGGGRSITLLTLFYTPLKKSFNTFERF